MTIQWDGGCSCGQIRYQITAEPAFSFHCQCRQCQRLTGAGHASQLMINKKGVSILGDMAFYEQLADGGHRKSNGFCGHCGSPILTKTTSNPDVLFFHAASLDDPSTFRPEKALFTSSGQGWDYLDPGLETA